MLFLFVLIQIGCTDRPSRVETKKLIHPNPTSVVFNVSLNKLRDTVIKLFGTSSQINDPVLASVFIDRILKDSSFPVNFSCETADGPVFGKDYFKRAGSSGDLFLFSMGSYWNSPLYFHNNKAFLFSCSFAFRFKAISDKQTLLEVIDVDPEISNGTKCCGPEGNYAITQKVRPTTIEEYTLILYLAEKLHVTRLKPIQLPI
jgi:hypothetical protein